jgi:hypothetical protein
MAAMCRWNFDVPSPFLFVQPQEIAMMFKRQPRRFATANNGAANGAGSAPFPTTTPGPQPANRSDSWFEAMAQAWGTVMDQQAEQIVNLSSQMTAGSDNPGTAIQLQAQAQKLAFLSTAASTSVNTAGNAIEVLSKKQ